jgi:hypothetical protein
LSLSLRDAKQERTPELESTIGSTRLKLYLLFSGILTTCSTARNSWDYSTTLSVREAPVDSTAPVPSYLYDLSFLQSAFASLIGIPLADPLQKELASYYCGLTMYHQTSSCARSRGHHPRMAHQRYPPRIANLLSLGACGASRPWAKSPISRGGQASWK